MSALDGSIIFKTPDKEVLRFSGDGTILVEGRPVECDEQVLLALKTIFDFAPGKAQPVLGINGGDVTIQSGVGFSNGVVEARGGDVVLTHHGFKDRWVYFNEKGLPTDKLPQGARRP